MAGKYTLPGTLLSGTHSGRPAASAVASGALYAETDTKQTYQSDGASTWTAWGAGAAAGIVQASPSISFHCKFEASRNRVAVSRRVRRNAA